MARFVCSFASFKLICCTWLHNLHMAQTQNDVVEGILCAHGNFACCSRIANDIGSVQAKKMCMTGTHMFFWLTAG